MDKYINSTKVLDFIQDCLNHEDKISDTEKATLIAIQRYIERTQIEDVAPMRHGRWEKATGMMPPEYCGLHICSECGHYAGRKPPYGGREMLSDYCPNCGAKMDKEE